MTSTSIEVGGRKESGFLARVFLWTGGGIAVSFSGFVWVDSVPPLVLVILFSVVTACEIWWLKRTSKLVTDADEVDIGSAIGGSDG